MFTNTNSKYPLSFHRHKKEILVVVLIATVIITNIGFYTYIKFDPMIPSDYPKIYIKCEEELNNDDYANCTFELISKNEKHDVPEIKSKIKVRGVYNARQPKKGYRIELSNRISLLGMRKDDDWQLFAMFLDLSNMRIKLSFDMWRSLENLNPTAILPDSEFVCLYINGEFLGIYLLAEKNDRRLYELDRAQDNINSSLIFQSDSHGTNFLEYSPGSWEQDWPNEDEDIYILDEIMIKLTYFIRYSSNQEFFDPNSGVFSLFNKENLMDFFLFNFFILHKDFWSQNYFIIRDTYPAYFCLIPWDFDSSFGQYMNRKYDADENPESEILTRNYLYNRLLQNEEFKSDLKSRWKQLRNILWTEEFIMDLATEVYEEVNLVLKIDSKLWYPLIFENEWEEKVDDAINYLFDWIPERIMFCDIYFENLS
ncbi:MAG: hypothetical protein EU548_00860 [Promethearchaeota archaeon]|nr:MAG: hypothetical protein EU548_00860 [Candidatus Lokiarchaeota archaeon]